jgi:hypothetical protein
VAILAIAVAGVGLFGSGMRGLVEVDGDLADATDRPAVRDVKRELGGRDDCPDRKKHRSERDRPSERLPLY